MPAERLPMRQVREVLRLKHAAGFSERQVAAALRISRSTVAEYLRRAAVIGITWPVPAELDDAALEERLFSPPFAVHERPRPQPDWPRLHAELRRQGVTLLLLWEEYRSGHPEGSLRLRAITASMRLACCGAVDRAIVLVHAQGGAFTMRRFEKR